MSVYAEILTNYKYSYDMRIKKSRTEEDEA